MSCGLELGEFMFACFFFHFIKLAVLSSHIFWQMIDTKGSIDPNCQDMKGQTTWSADGLGYCLGPTHITASSWQCQEKGEGIKKLWQSKISQNKTKQTFVIWTAFLCLYKQEPVNFSEQVWMKPGVWWCFCAPEPSKTWNCLGLSM